MTGGLLGSYSRAACQSQATTSAWPGSLKRLEIHGSQGIAVIEDEDILKWEFADPEPGDDEILEKFSAKNRSEGGASDPSALSM